MLKIPFYKPSLGPEEIAEVVDTLKSGWLTTGAKTKQFERAFGAYVRQSHSVAVNSCTAALHLALEAIGVKEGDGVLVPTMTFAATAEVVRYLGAVPILVDCQETDFNLDVLDAERRLKAALAKGQRVVAIMPVHFGGQIGDVTGVARLAREYNLKIIEDAAHCCPAYFRGAETAAADGPKPKHLTESTPSSAPSSPLPAPSSSPWLPVGASADITCFSFYANKCITTGEGGMACTENEAYADRMRIMSLHGISRDAWKRFTGEGSWYYEIIAPGYKYNLTDIAAAIGLQQLRKADQLHARRTFLANQYRARLCRLEQITLPESAPDRVHSWHLFPLRLRLDRTRLNRAEFIDAMKEAGIGTSVHYLPLHMHPYYRDNFGYRAEDLPRMAAVYPRIVTLPLYPDLSEADMDYVCGTVERLLK